MHCAFPRFTDLVNVHPSHLCLSDTISLVYRNRQTPVLLLWNSWILLAFLLPSAWLTALRQWWRWWPLDLLEEVVLKDPRSASNLYKYKINCDCDCVVCPKNAYLTQDVHSGSVSATASIQESTNGDGPSWLVFLLHMCCN